ncbi:MAG: hypothetical protein HON90_15025, partial [Halobacteriovoraceae bacterium]|nr:hypothetical protein [Halobacteriovoraceae bacterium]
VRQQKVISKVRRLSNKGWSYRKIAKHLNSSKILSPSRKGLWYGLTVKRLTKD